MILSAVRARLRASENTARFLASTEWLIASLLIARILWRGVIAGWRTLNTDFPNYYVAARLMRGRGSFENLYDWTWFQRAADHLGIRHQLVGFLGLTPFSALPLIPFTFLPVLTAKRCFIVVNLVLLVLCVRWLQDVSGLPLRRVLWILSL